jgi:hypothetical protein
VFTRARHWSLFRARRIQSTLSYPISLRSILILSFHLPNLPKYCMHSLSLPCMLHVQFISSWRRLRNEELHNLYTSQDRVIKLRIRWAGHVASMGEIGMHTVFWLGNLKGRHYSEDLCVDGRIILEGILRK